MQENIAFIESLYSAEYKTLLKYATVVMGDSYTAQDIVQDTFHEAIRKTRELLTHPNPSAWLMVTLKYKLKAAQRQRKSDLKMLLALELSYSNSDLDLVDNKLELKAVIDQMQHCLSTEDYYIFRRFFIDNASHLQIAQELSITVWTSQKRVERIRKEAKRQFPDRAGGKQGCTTFLVLLCGFMRYRMG